jgi:hypothetical protein
MSYMGPRMIKEPVLRWPVYLVAGIITILFVALTAAVLNLSLHLPSTGSGEEPRLGRVIRPGAPLFEPSREKSLVKQVVTAEDFSRFNDAALEMYTVARKLTTHSISGPKMREAAVDEQRSASAAFKQC